MHCGVACWWDVVLLYSRNNGKGCYLPSCLEGTGGCSHPVVLNCVFESCCPDFERMVLHLTSVGLLMGTKLQAWAKVLLCADWFLLASVCLHACWPSGSHHSSSEMYPSSVHQPGYLHRAGVTDDACVCFLHPFSLLLQLLQPSLSLSFLTFLEWLLSALSKTAFTTCHNQSIVTTVSEAAPSGVKESHCLALLVYSPHALPRQWAKILQ